MKLQEFKNIHASGKDLSKIISSGGVIWSSSKSVELGYKMLPNDRQLYLNGIKDNKLFITIRYYRDEKSDIIRYNLKTESIENIKSFSTYEDYQRGRIFVGKHSNHLYADWRTKNPNEPFSRKYISRFNYNWIREKTLNEPTDALPHSTMEYYTDRRTEVNTKGLCLVVGQHVGLFTEKGNSICNIYDSYRNIFSDISKWKYRIGDNPLRLYVNKSGTIGYLNVAIDSAGEVSVSSPYTVNADYIVGSWGDTMFYVNSINSLVIPQPNGLVNFVNTNDLKTVYRRENIQPYDRIYYDEFTESFCTRILAGRNETLLRVYDKNMNLIIEKRVPGTQEVLFENGTIYTLSDNGGKLLLSIDRI